PFDADGVLLHSLDVAERLAPGLVLDQGMHRPQRAEIDDQLLAFGRKAVALEQSRRVRVGRGLEESVRTGDERDAFLWVDEFNWTAAFLDLQHVVFAAVRHDGAFA